MYLFLTSQGTVKVHARLLSAAAESKTYVITTRTTARDLIAMVIASYRTICEDNTLFNLVLETGNSRRAGKNITCTFVPCMTKSRQLCVKLFESIFSIVSNTLNQNKKAIQLQLDVSMIMFTNEKLLFQHLNTNS